MFHEFLTFSKEVNEAIKEQKPIVALESSILSHSLDYPANLHMAKHIETLIRQTNAIPATIALIAGKIQIGLDDEMMDDLAKAEGLIKASKRDLAFILSRGYTATTTATATMFCAHLANLPVFVTGSLGGIHHQVGENSDIFADLVTLSETPITVICSGAKSILDLPKTLEMLETYGVAIIGYGTDKFPTFHSQRSASPLLKKLNTVKEIATLMHYQKKLSLNHGIIIANPALNGATSAKDAISPLIKQVLLETNDSDSKITPFIIQRIAKLTAQNNLYGNLELIKNNAVLGAEIAIEYKKYN